MLPPLQIRRAGKDDEALIARLYFAAWRETYDGLLRDAASTICSRSAERWREGFDGPAAAKAIFLISRTGDAPAGFVACGPVQHAKLVAAGFAGEMYSLYLLKHIQGEGAGRLLMRTAARHLLSRGIHDAGAVVLRDNDGIRRFLKALGAVETKIEGVVSAMDQTFPSLAYRFCDLALLAALGDRTVIAQSKDGVMAEVSHNRTLS